MSKSLTLSSAKKSGRGGGGGGGSGDELWRHSREPIKLPLLKKLMNKDELREEVSTNFISLKRENFSSDTKQLSFSAGLHGLPCYSEIHGRPTFEKDEDGQRAHRSDLRGPLKTCERYARLR